MVHGNSSAPILLHERVESGGSISSYQFTSLVYLYEAFACPTDIFDCYVFCNRDGLACFLSSCFTHYGPFIRSPTSSAIPLTSISFGIRATVKFLFVPPSSSLLLQPIFNPKCKKLQNNRLR
ncbi:hypothetical protein SCLCIDRAFT_1212577 [Scleroderma citrinum Foug A]|uniref:Uncharacterized protein n=1 Tax=Scleroderma citrinum Foug A TaxID=1036808 RepID=A0A0C3DX13_9AGAM|nr:hypothetical protein SCLCIDRAFT_1212577 [Scleroderma citrinum Foug A]